MAMIRFCCRTVHQHWGSKGLQNTYAFLPPSTVLLNIKRWNSELRDTSQPAAEKTEKTLPSSKKDVSFTSES